MKVKAIAVLMYMLIFMIGIVLIPPPAAQACYAYCSLDNCNSTSEFGYYRARSFPDPTYFVVLEKPMCIGSRQEQLYVDCAEYPCIGSIGNGGLAFHLDNDMVSVFTVRNKREGDAVVASIAQIGLTKTYATFPVVDKFAAKDWNQKHAQLLAKYITH